MQGRQQQRRRMVTRLLIKRKYNINMRPIKLIIFISFLSLSNYSCLNTRSGNLKFDKKEITKIEKLKYKSLIESDYNKENTIDNINSVTEIINCFNNSEFIPTKFIANETFLFIQNDGSVIFSINKGGKYFNYGGKSYRLSNEKLKHLNKVLRHDQ